MKNVALCFGLLLLAAAPPNADRFDALAGTWSCQSMHQSTGTWTFSLRSDGTMTMTNHFVMADGRPGEWDEIYTPDTEHGTRKYQARFTQNPNMIEEGVASQQWTDDKLTFEGSVIVTPPHSHDDSIYQTRVVRMPLRVTYTALGSDSLRRDVQIQRDGNWRATASSTCTRDVASGASQN